MHTGNHTLAVVKGDEDYDTISKAFTASFDEINKLQQTGFVTVDGIRYKTELFMCSDMKVHSVTLVVIF